MTEKEKKVYVLGFMFTPNKRNVVLINKKRPEWQKGLLNGVGGKLEDDESLTEAMTREFFEETGVYVIDWILYSTITEEDSIIYCFYILSQSAYTVYSKTDEEVQLYDMRSLCGYKTLPNIDELIKTALAHNDNYYEQELSASDINADELRDFGFTDLEKDSNYMILPIDINDGANTIQLVYFKNEQKFELDTDDTVGIQIYFTSIQQIADTLKLFKLLTDND